MFKPPKTFSNYYLSPKFTIHVATFNDEKAQGKKNSFSGEMAHSKIKESLHSHIWAFSNQFSFATQHSAGIMEILLKENDFVCEENPQRGISSFRREISHGQKKSLETAGRLKKQKNSGSISK